MVRAEQKLHRHPLSEQPGGDVGGDDASADMLVFIGAVKTCQGDRVGDFLRVQKLKSYFNLKLKFT